METGLPGVDSSDIDATTTTGIQIYHCMADHQLQHIPVVLQ